MRSACLPARSLPLATRGVLPGAALALALVARLSAPAIAAAEAVPSPETSVLRINVTHQGHSFRLPWQKESPGSRTALGALIADRKVLVLAEIVADASYVEIEKPGSGEKLTARVEVVDYEANLALVGAAEDPGDFFDGLIPLEIDSGAQIGDTLSVWQFEPNGSAVTTEVRLDQFDLGNYFLASSYFLIFEATGTLQYRDGTFTLPVVRDGRLAGLLLEYRAGDELSTILPAPIIAHFLEDLAEPPYRGFPNFGIKFARTLDDQLRRYAQMGDRSNGIFVSGVIPGTSAAESGLREGDVILEIAGHPVDARGNYEDPRYGVLGIAHLVKGDVFTGDTIDVKLLRDGEEQVVPVTLVRKEPGEYLVDPYMFDRGPRYLVMGGMLFQELTEPFLRTFGDKWETRAPFKLVYANNNQELYEEEGRRKLVFLSGVLPSRSTLGYERIAGLIVSRVNGRTINDLRDLDAAFAEPGDDGIHHIEFDDYPHQVFLDAALAEADNNDLLPARYRIFQLKRLD